MTINRARFSSKLSTRFIVLLVACTLVASILGATAYMQTRKEKAAAPVAQPAEQVSLKNPMRAVGEKEEAAEATVAQDVQGPQVASNYTFTTATNASLTDMSAGTTQLVAADQDDTASLVTNIGFDFYFQGVRFTQFSANSNGLIRLGSTAVQGSSPYKPLAQASIPLLTPYGADQRTLASTGKVHFKVTGTTPNRVLNIEWLNMQANFNSGGTSDLTYQARLYETTGVIEYVYGKASMSAAGALDVNSKDPNIGFSSSNTAGTVGSVTAAQSGTPAPTFDGASATAVANTFTAGTIPVLDSATNGSRRIFTFTPPTPSAPTNLTFTSVTPTSMTLNWADNATNEVGYALYQSTDNVNFTFITQTAANATSQALSGLAPSTTYFFKVFAVTEGALSSALAGSQATAAAATITSTPVGGNWSSTLTWIGGVVPTAGDNVVIADLGTVTVDVATATCLNLQVGQGISGTLQYITTPASTLTVNGNVTVSTGGTFTAGSGVLLTHVLNIGGSTAASAAAGSLTNNGTFDMNTTAGVTTNFFGSADGTVSGTGATCDFFAIILNKGTSITPVEDVTRVITIGAPAASANRLSATNGTFKLSSASTLTPWFGSQTLTATTGRLWLNNAAASTTVVGVGTGTGAGAPTINGTLRVDAGTFGYGSGNNTMTIGAAGSLIIGGANATVNQFGAVSFTSGSTFTMTAGNFNVDPQAANNLGATTNIVRFNSVNVAFTGGTLTVVDPHAATGTAVALSISTSSASTFNFAGSTIRFGNGVSTTAGSVDGFDIDTFVGLALVSIGNVTVDNTATNAATRFVRAANALSPFTQTYNGNLILTNSGGSQFKLNGHLVAITGNVANDGIIDGSVASSRLYFAGSTAQTYSGIGTAGTNALPLQSVDFDSTGGVTFNSAVNNLITNRTILFTGSVTNANKLTLGVGGTSIGTVQIGNTTTPTNAGSFDVPLTFNLGTGGEVISYLRTTNARTIGSEVNPTRTLASLTYDDNDATHALTIAGGDLTVTGATTLTTGRIITGANNYIVGSAGTVTRTAGYVDGNLRKTFTATGSKTFEVGTANGYSPFAANVTAGTGDFTAKATQGKLPAISGTNALSRYWTLTATGLTADLTFNYLAGDVVGTEANYKIFKYNTAFTSFNPTTLNTTTHVATLTGVAEAGAVQPGTLAFSQPTYSVSETGPSVSIDVTRTGGTDGGISVHYDTADGTATAGSDYTAQSSALNWAAGDATNKTIVIPITDDSLYEGATGETFTVALSAPTGGATLGSPASATVTINDNDTAPAFTINDVTHAEGNSGPTAYTFTVTKAGGTALNATVDYATVDGTATAPSDYTAIPTTTLTFLPADTTKQFTVFVNGDTTFEPDEAFTVHLSTASGATISDADGTGAITNDDARPQPNTVYVDDDFASLPNGSDPPGPGTEIGYDAFATVQGGVTGVAAGGTVNVAAGNYPEQVTISKSLTLIGAGAATTNIITPASLAPGIGGNLVLVQVDSAAVVDMSGITVKGPRIFNGCPAQIFYGVYVAGAANLNLHDAAVKDIRLADPSLYGCQDGNAIRAGSQALSQPATLTVNNVTLSGYQKTGIIVDGTGTTANITNSTLTGFGPENLAQNAIQIGRNASATVTGNQISGSECNNAVCGPDPFTQAFGTGLLIFSTNGPVQITNNTISNNDTGIYNNAPGTTISGNTMVGNRFNGIFLDEGSANITGNTLSGPMNVGVTAVSFVGNGGNSDGTLTSNTITGATTGVQLLDDTSGSDAFVPQLTAHFNRIIATTTAIDDSANTLFITGAARASAPTAHAAIRRSLNSIDGLAADAALKGLKPARQAPTGVTNNLENNWWGCNAGPGNTGCGAVTGTNVDFNPWFVLAASATPNSIIPGASANVAVDMTHNSDGAVPATALPATPVSYSAINGTMNPTSGTVTNGTAASTFTSTNGSNATATVTVDNQNINVPITVNAPSFTINDVAHNEGDSGTTMYVFTVTKTGATMLASAVDFTTVDGTATVANNDYVTNSGTLNFGAADTMMQFTVLVNGDTTFEPDEAFTVHLSNATNATIADADGTGTITNDDASASGSLQFSAASYTVNESYATATITVTRTGGTDNAVSVEYATSDGTAMQPGDYASTTGTLNWAGGDAAPKTFTVTIVNDTTAEPDETVNLTLSNPQGGASLGAQTTATLTIQDNDAAPTVKVIRPGGLQGWTQQHANCNDDPNTGSQAFVVGPGTPPAGEGSLQYLIGSDGNSFETIRNPDYNNTTLNSLSNLSYSTYAAGGGAGGQAPYLLLNIDNDNDGTLDDQLFFEPVYQNGTYSKIFADDTIPNQCGANPACVTTGQWQNWNALVGGWWSGNESAGGPPLITLRRYAVEHPNARIVNTNTGAGGFRIATGCGAGAWDNFDGNADNVLIGVGATNTLYDLEPLPRLSIDDVTHMEGNSGTTAYTFNVTLSEPSDQTITVDYATADDTATAPSDYTALPTTTLTFDPGQTSKQVTVQVNGDFTLEPDETFFVNLSNVNANATILDGQGVGTIQNDDVAMVGISISDAFAAEPAAGTSTATFTVSLSAPSTQTVTVDYATADGTAVAPGDYTAIPTTQLSFMPGQVTKTINVTVNGDGLTEGNENFFVNLSNPSGNATITDPQGQGTITDPTATGQMLISEFRFRGPTFSAPQNIDGFRDEYVELYNNTNNPITVATTDGSQGWTLAALNSSGTGADVLVQIPNGTVIPARGHFLAINSDETTTTRPNIVPEGGYSLNGYAVGDAFYVTDVSDNAGVAIFNTANVANFTAANRIDAVGFTGPVGATADTFREGAGLQSPGAVDGQYAFVRRLETGIPQDTNDNAQDFVFIATDGGTYGGVQSILGAPGPENCGCFPTNQFPDHSPTQRNAQIKASLIEPQALSTAPPNRVRDAAAVGPNASQGTLELRRRFKNTTGQPVTRLRFRVVDVTTLNTPNPGGVQADIRWLSSTDTPVSTSLGNLTLRGTVIETPPAQGSGGGLNSTGVVTLPGGALANGATIDVRFVLGVQAPGRFRFFVNVEALP
jgi:hypothetical protein